MKNRETAASRIVRAIFRKDVDELRAAVAAGEDVNARDGDGRTPLHYAVIDGTDALVDLVLAIGGDVNIADNQGWTALHFAAQEWRESVAEKLLAAGAVVDATDSHGNTPLMRAVFSSRGRPELIRLLLSASADKNRRNHSGVSARDLAQRIANYEIAGLLGD